MWLSVGFLWKSPKSLVEVLTPDLSLGLKMQKLKRTLVPKVTMDSIMHNVRQKLPKQHHFP
jgi:hypothetical protein